MFGNLKKWFDDKVLGTNISAGEKSIQNAQQQLQQQPAKFGVLANPQVKQQFTQSIQPKPFSLKQAGTDTLKEVGTGIGLGAIRSVTGLGQGVSGVYDLATPGLGTNRVSKGLDSFAKRTDETNSQFGRTAAYKIAQVGTDLATFGAIGKGLNLAGKSQTIKPIVKSFNSTKVGKYNQAINKGLNRTIQAGGKRSIPATAAKYAKSPSNALNMTQDMAVGLGQPASKGQDIGWKDVALQGGMSLGIGVGLPVTAQGLKVGRQQFVAPGMTPSDSVRWKNVLAEYNDAEVRGKPETMKKAARELDRLEAKAKSPVQRAIDRRIPGVDADGPTRYGKTPKDLSQSQQSTQPLKTGDIQASSKNTIPELNPQTATPKGFIIKESKPRNGRKDTIRVTTDKDGRLVKTMQSELAPSTLDSAPVPTKEDMGNLLMETDRQNPKKPYTEPEVLKAPPTKAEEKQAIADFMALTNKYLGAEESGKIGAVATARNYDQKFGGLTAQQKLDAILVSDGMKKSKDPAVLQAVDALKTQYDESYNMYTKDKGLKMGFQQEYSPRIYKDANGNTLNAQEYKLLQQGSGRMKGRKAQDLMPDSLVSQDPAELLRMYHSSLEKAVAGQRYMNDLEKSGLITMSTDGSPVRGMKPIVAEGMQNEGVIYYAKPEVADKLNKLFGSQEASGFVEKTLENAAGFNSFMQSVVLSGGVPNTPINAFGIMQLMKNGMALHPIQGGKAFLTGLSRNHATKFFDQHEPYMRLMAENGLDTRYDFSIKPNNGRIRIKQASDEKGVGAAVNQAWNEVTNDATFGRFMPALEVLHYKGVYEGLLKKGVDQPTAAKQAADATANFYGKNSLAKDATASKVGRDFTGATLFAPRFRESMLNFWVKNAESLDPRGGFKNARSIEYRDNLKFMGAAAATWATMEGANMALNGNWMHDNPDGKKDKLLIPGGSLAENKVIGLPFLPSVATVPRNLAMGAYNTITGNFEEAGKNVKSFASMPLQTVGEVLTNEDYFGGRIYDENATSGEKLLQTGSYVARDNMQPWIREGLNIAGQGLADGTKKMFGIKEKGAFETASNALEAPVRFYDPKYFKGGKQDAQGNTSFGGVPTKSSSKADKPDDIIKAAFGNEQGKAFLKLKNDDERIAFANESADNLGLYKQWIAMKKGLEGNKTTLNTAGLDEGSQNTLKKWESLTEEGQKNVLKNNPRMEYDLEVAKWRKASAEGSLSKVEDIKKQNELVKLEISVKYDKDARDISSMNKNQVYDIISKDPNGKFYAEQLLAYNDELVAKGIIKDHPYRDKWGNVDFDPSSIGSGGGRGRGRGGGVNLPDISFAGSAPGDSPSAFKISSISAPKTGGLKMPGRKSRKRGVRIKR